MVHAALLVHASLAPAAMATTSAGPGSAAPRADRSAARRSAPAPRRAPFVIPRSGARRGRPGVAHRLVAGARRRSRPPYVPRHVRCAPTHHRDGDCDRELLGERVDRCACYGTFSDPVRRQGSFCVVRRTRRCFSNVCRDQHAGTCADPVRRASRPATPGREHACAARRAPNDLPQLLVGEPTALGVGHRFPRSRAMARAPHAALGKPAP